MSRLNRSAILKSSSQKVSHLSFFSVTTEKKTEGGSCSDFVHRYVAKIVTCRAIFGLKRSTGDEASHNFNKLIGLHGGDIRIFFRTSSQYRVFVINNIIASSAQTVHALRILRSHSMQTESIHTIYQAVVIAKLTYASSAWWGFTTSTDRQRLEAVVTFG